MTAVGQTPQSHFQTFFQKSMSENMSLWATWFICGHPEATVAADQGGRGGTSLDSCRFSALSTWWSLSKQNVGAMSHQDLSQERAQSLEVLAESESPQGDPQEPMHATEKVNEA